MHALARARTHTIRHLAVVKGNHFFFKPIRTFLNYLRNEPERGVCVSSLGGLWGNGCGQAGRRAEDAVVAAMDLHPLGTRGCRWHLELPARGMNTRTDTDDKKEAVT